MAGQDSPAAAQRLHVRIAAILAAEIAEGQHPPGQHLVETQLANRFSVSRAPVRLALARLTAAGWLDYLPARGHLVRAAHPHRQAPDSPEPDTAGAEPAAHGPELGVRHAWEAIHAQVEDAITARIAFGSWQVPETALARSFGVSRTVARDVLARLQGRGLVEMQGGRWVAPGLDARRIDELYRLRALLEPAALHEIGPALPPGLAAAAIDRLHAAAGAPASVATLDALEQDLHVDLLAHCPNATLIAAIRQPQSLLIAHRFLYRTTAALFGVEPFIAEHLLVFEALAQGRIPQAAGHLHDHLMESRIRAVRRLESLRSGIAAALRDEIGDLAYLRPMVPGD